MVKGHLGAVLEHHHTASVVHLADFGVAKPDILGFAEDGADGIGDFGGLEHGRCHLVEQGQKGVEVVLVDDGDAHALVRQPPGGRDAGKSPANDDHVR